MTDRKKRIDAAIRAAKKRYDNICILSGVDKPEGAHILPRKPYSEFVDKPWNIVPLQNNLHIEIDKYRKLDINNRLKYLYRNCLPEYRGKLRDQIREFIFELNDVYPQMIIANLIESILE